MSKEELPDLTLAVIDTITELRRKAGLTLEELADRAGLHRTTLGLVERGERGLTIGSAARIAGALDLSLGKLLAIAEASGEGVPLADLPAAAREAPTATDLHADKLQSLAGLTPAAVRGAISYAYDTLDIIDAELAARDVPALSRLVELANLSSMLGNLLGAGLAESSSGSYVRNRPHAFPDLVPQRAALPDLEVKTALETNRPKGHLPKAGTYITFRYVLGTPDGGFVRGKDNRGVTVWIWEVRVGRLKYEDFDISNTDGDSGKTATIKTRALQEMSPVYFDERFMPYARAWGGLPPRAESGQ